MAEQHNTPAYISNVHLKGYKSIRDMEVRLNPGLNIIIGKNGSGKTNFVEFLSKALFINNKPIIEKPYFLSIEFSSMIGSFVMEEKFVGVRNNIEDWDENLEKFYTKIIDNNSISYIKNQRLIGLRTYFNKDSKIYTLLNPVTIPFTTPNSFARYMLSDLGQISIDEYNYTVNILASVFENWLEFEFRLNEDIIHKDIEKLLLLNKSLILNLNRYSPIQNLRLSKSLNIEITEHKIELNYIMLEFFVNNEWLSWQQLSDGTKRLFHIISEINGTDRNLIFLEEPENGVHPDQLYLLMDFIKEQSKEKQIILTTHSPEVLNILEKDELDRIIVTRFEEDKKTQMHHLSEKQKAKAMLYMEETSNLSDFWVHSTLEEYEAELETAE